MIWFGRHPGLHIPSPVRGRVPVRDRDRMRAALEQIAAHAPHLTGAELLDALGDTGWIDRATAKRLLPEFRNFDPDRHFAEHMRRLSFRGPSASDEFHAGIGRIVADLFGSSRETEIAAELAFRFQHAEQEGLILGYPMVQLAIGGTLQEAVTSAIEEVPDALVIVARNFHPAAAEQLRGLLSSSEVPGTLITINLLLGVRATVLRYQPHKSRVVRLLGAGRPLRSADVARLVDA